MADRRHAAGSRLGPASRRALIICAVVGFALQQSALQTGVLAPTMAGSLPHAVE
jgi:hypothetical protein